MNLKSWLNLNFFVITENNFHFMFLLAIIQVFLFFQDYILIYLIYWNLFGFIIKYLIFWIALIIL